MRVTVRREPNTSNREPRPAENVTGKNARFVNPWL